MPCDESAHTEDAGFVTASVVLLPGRFFRDIPRNKILWALVQLPMRWANSEPLLQFSFHSLPTIFLL